MPGLKSQTVKSVRIPSPREALLIFFYFPQAHGFTVSNMANIETAAPSAGYNEQPMSEKGKMVRNLVEADLLDERYATTQRGLKNRHVQLMALGGTIGTGDAKPIYHY